MDKDQVRLYMRISYLADKMDMNDFMMANLPYLLLYKNPVPREPVVFHSNSLALPPMTLKSPSEETDSIQRETELVGPHVTSDPSVEGIDKFETNTFQIYTWMAFPAVPCVSSSELNAPIDQ